MNFKSLNFKIYLGSAYLIVLLAGIYFLFSNFDISDLTSYEFIRENKGLILKYKENNILFLTIIFFIITVFLNLLLCPMLIPTLIIGFIFGKWLGTLILIFGNTLGGFLLYRLAKTFFSDLIEKKFKTKFSKFINFFNKNDTLYFMCFRFIGGGGTPFPIQNVLPVLFNMSAKNYIIATFLGIIPTTFVTVALGSGIEDVIDSSTELSFSSVFQSPEIFIPIVGIFIILIGAFVIKKVYLKSLSTIGINYKEHDIRLVEDDWESPTLGAAGLGWEVWCDGMEITQFTYFQQMAGIECKPVSVELTYGLERICMFTQGKNNVFDLIWNNSGMKYRDIFHQAEKEYSAYNFEYANTEYLMKNFEIAESECKSLLEKKLSLPAYDQCLKASHVFNLLDARGVIGVAQRTEYISRIRELAKGSGEIWLESQK